jgi:PIN domain nuclease of toxin-antitoxin system
VRLLLDTHTFLWWLDRPEELSDRARVEIANGRNLVFVSAASFLEVALKSSKGKLTLSGSLDGRLEECRFTALPITPQHALAVALLPPLHKDPFDRLLVAQARAEELTLVTRDGKLSGYGVPTLAA